MAQMRRGITSSSTPQKQQSGQKAPNKLMINTATTNLLQNFLGVHQHKVHNQQQQPIAKVAKTAKTAKTAKVAKTAKTAKAKTAPTHNLRNKPEVDYAAREGKMDQKTLRVTLPLKSQPPPQPPPQPPNMNALLGQIQQGTKLQDAAQRALNPAPKQPENPRDALMNALKKAGHQLKQVQRTPEEVKAARKQQEEAAAKQTELGQTFNLGLLGQRDAMQQYKNPVAAGQSFSQSWSSE